MANKAVNDFILAMNYDKKKLLTHQGESIENRFIKEGNQLPTTVASILEHFS